MAGMTIWGPVISLVLVTSPDGFPRQPDTTQGIHAFRANPGVAVQSTQWVANSSVQQVVETEFEVRQSKHDRLHLFRQSFQTVGQPWALWPKASNRVEVETFGQPAPNYSLFFGRASQMQPTQPWSAYKWTSPVPDIQEYRPQWTDHNAAYAPFQTRAGLIANQPWNAYRWQIQAPDTAPYVEYRSRDFWADYLPFTITPAVVIQAGGSNPGGGGGGRVHGDGWSGKFEFSKQKPKRETLTLRREKTASDEINAEKSANTAVKASNELVKTLSFNINDDDEETLTAVLEHERQLILKVLGSIL